MLKKLSLMVVSTASVFAMHSAEININDKDLELNTKFDLGQFNDTVEPDTTFLGMSYIKGNLDNSNSAIRDYFDINFLMRQEIQDSGVNFGIAVKVNYTKVNKELFVTIPLGLEIGYRVPVEVPVLFNAKVYYAPESLAYGEAESFLEYRVDACVEVIKKGSLVLGYRNLDTNLQNTKGNQKYNESVYFGFRFAF